MVEVKMSQDELIWVNMGYNKLIYQKERSYVYTASSSYPI